MDNINKGTSIAALEIISKEILSLKHSLGTRRPLVIEFCGTPKAGKTTTISALNIFLKRNDFKTIVIGEMAGICPIPSKTDFFFNSWTLFNSLSEMLKQLAIGDNKIDIILIDRSLFDAMCWFKWLSCNDPKHPFISAAQYHAFASFLIETNMWTRYIDLVYIFKTDPAEALKREFSELLTEKTGTIMNPKVLESYNKSITEIKSQYSQRFRAIEEYDTTGQDPNLVSFDVTNKILNVLRELLTEKIGYFLDTFKIALKEGVNEYELVKNRILFLAKETLLKWRTIYNQSQLQLSLMQIGKMFWY